LSARPRHVTFLSPESHPGLKKETGSVPQILHSLPDILYGTIVELSVIDLTVDKSLPGCKVLEKAEALAGIRASFPVDPAGNLCPFLSGRIFIGQIVFLVLVDQGVFAESLGKLGHFLLGLIGQLRFVNLSIEKAVPAGHILPGANLHSILLLVLLAISLIGMYDAFLLAFHIQPPVLGKKISRTFSSG
jgi:hypothetical protein